VVRTDGAVILDVYYRLLTDDGENIIIDNKGMGFYNPSGERYRMNPEFIAPVGKYGWLNKNMFVATLVDVPAGSGMARGPDKTDRSIQGFRLV